MGETASIIIALKAAVGEPAIVGVVVLDGQIVGWTEHIHIVEAMKLAMIVVCPIGVLVIVARINWQPVIGHTVRIPFAISRTRGTRGADGGRHSQIIGIRRRGRR